MQENNIKKVIAVMSGKGGVGKSTVVGLVASYLRKKDYAVGILDADITGPSIPKIFGINKKRAEAIDVGIFPVETVSGIKVMSINLLIDKEDSPVIWRGPLIGGTVERFYKEVLWEELDYLIVDLPPGTGDAPLTVMQKIPLSGVILVSSPQELVKLIVKKAIHMAEKMDVPIIGLIENMSYFKCPKCGEITEIFGKSEIEAVARETGISVLGKIPLNTELVELSDEGRLELFTQINEEYSDIVDKIEERLKVKAK